ncbi:Oidioi.mRNA.OKI2018_I69.chr2.g5319.t1.cds [Oikopleura dioica]|uniref:Oidioi.mRNA.OKI2018_I69.chr2.g5319.t1.cds n=1 Tax=Oikopleura dioica TaxID=34765 RepID=A0ABN7T1N4_OIKDI|nr:Oidioi.mRNA.OKI2018_I69.chr2.g5319.t1.cds [Oikopleura dioica]
MEEYVCRGIYKTPAAPPHCSIYGTVDGSTFESGEMEAEMDGDKFSCRTGVSSNLPASLICEVSTNEFPPISSELFQNGDESKLAVGVVVGICVGVFLLCLGVALFFVFRNRKNQKSRAPSISYPESVVNGHATAGSFNSGKPRQISTTFVGNYNQESDSEYSEEEVYSETDESSEDEIARIKSKYRSQSSTNHQSSRYQAVPLHHDTTTVDLTLSRPPQNHHHQSLHAPSYSPPPPPEATEESIQILKQFQSIFTANENANRKGRSGSKFQESVVI